MSTPEGRVLRACLDYLALCGIAAWRINTMGTPLAGQPGRFRPAPSRGIADIIGIGVGFCGLHGVKNASIAVRCPLAIEVKSATGRQSPAQVEFSRKWGEAGGLYIVVRSVEELRAKLREAGVEVK